MLAKKRQWKDWSLPSKYTAISLLLTILSLGLYFNDKIISYFQVSKELELSKNLYIYEKNKNMKLLNFLAKKLSGKELQKIIFQENFFLSLDSLDKYNNPDKLKELLELKKVLKSINHKIETLKEANEDMLTGDFTYIQKAIISFSSVEKKAQIAISLYNRIGI